MLYSILCYNSEALVGAWTKQKDAEVMAGHEAILLRSAIAAVHTQAERSKTRTGPRSIDSTPWWLSGCDSGWRSAARE